MVYLRPLLDSEYKVPGTLNRLYIGDSNDLLKESREQPNTVRRAVLALTGVDE